MHPFQSPFYCTQQILNNRAHALECKCTVSIQCTHFCLSQSWSLSPRQLSQLLTTFWQRTQNFTPNNACAQNLATPISLKHLRLSSHSITNSQKFCETSPRASFLYYITIAHVIPWQNIPHILLSATRATTKELFLCIKNKSSFITNLKWS